MFSFRDKLYAKIPLMEDSDEDVKEIRSYRLSVSLDRSRWLRPVMAITATILVAAISSFVTATIIHRSTQTHIGFMGKARHASHEEQISKQLTPYHCGTSVEEAVQLGCTFDYMSLQWLRPECGRAGNEEYLEFLQGNLTYYIDHEGKIPVPDLSTQVNEDGFWAQQRHHLAHCAFMYMRLVEAATTDGIFDRQVWNRPHARHCARALLDWAVQAPNLMDAKEWARVGFGTCWSRLDPIYEDEW